MGGDGSRHVASGMGRSLRRRLASGNDRKCCGIKQDEIFGRDMLQEPDNVVLRPARFLRFVLKLPIDWTDFCFCRRRLSSAGARGRNTVRTRCTRIPRPASPMRAFTVSRRLAASAFDGHIAPSLTKPERPSPGWEFALYEAGAGLAAGRSRRTLCSTGARPGWTGKLGKAVGRATLSSVGWERNVAALRVREMQAARSDLASRKTEQGRIACLNNEYGGSLPFFARR